MAPKVQFAVAAIVFLAGCSKPAEKEKAPAPVQLAAVTQATIRRVVQGDGALFPLDQASIMPKISAPVQRFYVNRGDHVKQGQLLAVLENRDLISAAAESQGAVEQAESSLRTTGTSAVPDSVVKAQTDLEAARETRDSAIRSAIREIRVPLVGSTITPIVVFLPLISITGVVGPALHLRRFPGAAHHADDI
jgi:multidrug efflux pump subunit AcrA (membrane-fusion protein)